MSDADKKNGSSPPAGTDDAGDDVDAKDKDKN